MSRTKMMGQMAMNKSNLSKNIKSNRKAAGLTQKQVADTCGMADSAIRKYESGKITPGIAMIEKIASAVGVSPFDLLAGVFDDG